MKTYTKKDLGKSAAEKAVDKYGSTSIDAGEINPPIRKEANAEERKKIKKKAKAGKAAAEKKAGKKLPKAKPLSKLTDDEFIARYKK